MRLHKMRTSSARARKKCGKSNKVTGLMWLISDYFWKRRDIWLYSCFSDLLETVCPTDIQIYTLIQNTQKRSPQGLNQYKKLLG